MCTYKCYHISLAIKLQ